MYFNRSILRMHGPAIDRFPTRMPPAPLRHKPTTWTLAHLRERYDGTAGPTKGLFIGRTFRTSMAKKKEPELRFQCLKCYKTYKGPEAEQKALDCCGSFIQGYWKYYSRWGDKMKWYGR